MKRKNFTCLSDIFNIQLPPTCDPSLELPDPVLLEHYRDDDSRTIWLLDEINGECYNHISSIIRWNKDDEGVSIHKRKPIKIIIDNAGGSLDIARSLCAVIDLSRTPVYTLGIGTVASAASLVYACGHKRYATKNTVFILHNGSCDNVSGTFNQLVAMFENYKREIDEMHQFYAEHTKYSEEELEERLENDWYIPVEEAIKHGLADEVITSIDKFYK